MMLIVTKVRIGELRDNVSQYVRRAEKGETIVIVNRTREVAVLSPWRPGTRRATRLVGCMKGTARVTGDILAPIAREDDWFRT
jgi:prevent-host-death family protein